MNTIAAASKCMMQRSDRDSPARPSLLFKRAGQRPTTSQLGRCRHLGYHAGTHRKRGRHMHPIELDELKSIELDILLAFHDYCEQKGLSYMLYYGTLLGAVRHQGFIPWDDDIDVVMPRDDYEAFFRSFPCDSSFETIKLISYRDRSSIYRERRWWKTSLTPVTKPAFGSTSFPWTAYQKTIGRSRKIGRP